jgi:hypothetical protein
VHTTELDKLKKELETLKAATSSSQTPTAAQPGINDHLQLEYFA